MIIDRTACYHQPVQNRYISTITSFKVLSRRRYLYYILGISKQVNRNALSTAEKRAKDSPSFLKCTASRAVYSSAIHSGTCKPCEGKSSHRCRAHRSSACHRFIDGGYLAPPSSNSCT